MPSSKRNPGKEGAASGGKGKGQSPPQGAPLPHSALRGPGASHKPRRRGAVEAHGLHEAGGTVFKVQGACLPVGFLCSDFLSPAGEKARLMRRSDHPQTRPAFHRRQTTSLGLA